MSRNSFIGVSLMAMIAMSTLITTISAAPQFNPIDPSKNVQGLFATYFANMVNTPCDSGFVIRGFLSNGTDYGKTDCVSITDLITTISPALLDITWLKNGTNISYIGGNVGIGIANPTANLEVAGQIKVTGGVPGLGKFLTSDATGLASWTTFMSGLPATALFGQTLRYDGLSWVANSNIYDNGFNIGIGTLSPLYKLEVNGKIGSHTTLSTDNDNTVTTKNYVDARLANLCTSLGGTWNNATGICTPAVTYSWQLGTTYGACSVTCGGGTQSAPAVCKQSNGTIVADALCAGAKPAAMSQSCNTQVCIPVVNGGWSVWGGGSCSASCGGGTMTQTRTCNNPAPSGGGANCGGSSTQSISCNTQACVVAVNGSCGGSANTCGAGSPSAYSAGSCGGSQTWSCLGSGGGTNATSCSIANAACALASCTYPGGTEYWGSCGVSIGATTIAHGGSAGPFTNTAGGYVGSISYGCNNGTFTVASQSCSPAPVNGSCGGGANTCGAGSPSGYSAGSCGGSQTWNCLGSGGGSSANCSIANAACINYTYTAFSAASGQACSASHPGYIEVAIGCRRDANGVFDGYDPWPMPNCPGAADMAGTRFRHCKDPDVPGSWDQSFDGNWIVF